MGFERVVGLVVVPPERIGQTRCLHKSGSRDGKGYIVSRPLERMIVHNISTRVE
jgi:hypothetical protein